MSKKFDPAKPHNHQCSECYAEIHCRAVGCEYPEYTECANCRQGWKDVIVEGTYVQRKEIPRINKPDRMFP